MEGNGIRRSWFLKRLAELHALTQLNEVKMLDRVYEVVKEYDDLLRVEVGEREVTVGVRRFNHGSRDRFVVNHRVSRIAVPLLEEPMPNIKLRKGSLNNAVESFLEWDNDPKGKEAYENLLNVADSDIDSAPATMAQLTFWAGVWYAKTHPEDVIIDEGGSKPEREIAPKFV